MKSSKQCLALVILLIFSDFYGKAQLAYSPFVESLSQQVTDDNIILLLRQLSGDTTVTINGQTSTITSRHYLSAGNVTAEHFIYDKLQDYGYQPIIQHFSGARGVNIIATKTGSVYPDQEYIICGHYDNMPSGNLAPGSDDNASGVVAMLEAARILSSMELEYTVRFAAWDEEEIGLVGSQYYAQGAFNNGAQILGVLNLDMIAWDSDDDFTYSISVDNNSEAFSNDFVTTTGYYQPLLNHNFINTTSSDHASFWQYGYPAILAIEDFFDFNDYYHTINDNMANVNLPYFGALVRASVTNIAANALNQRIAFIHDPIISGNSVLPHETTVVIESAHAIASGSNSPRLYYSTDSINFNFILPAEVTGNIYTFIIPGFPIGTTVNYYFAAQDVNSSMVATYPVGGRGINPPGTVLPQEFITYMVDNIHNTQNCSPNTPLPINDNSNTYDEFTVTENGTLLDLDVLVDITHPRTYELRLLVISPDNTSILMSDRNGGEGDNYTQTVFDDQADQSIEEGIAPFSGHFRPENPFNPLLNKQIAGKWKLRIVESGSSNTGTLNQWCLHFLYKDLDIGTTDLPVGDQPILFQNQPNPAVDVTSIKFHMPKACEMSLTLYDSRGTRIRTITSGSFQAGDHLIVTSLAGLETGVYFYRLESDLFTQTRKLIKVN